MTGWTKSTSCENTVSAIKNSASVPMKVNLTISLMDEIARCSMTVFTAQGFAFQASWKYAQENIERQKPITEMTESSG